MNIFDVNLSVCADELRVQKVVWWNCWFVYNIGVMLESV